MKTLKNKMVSNDGQLINKKGLTLVELIVVVTVLAILGTIAFISFQGYGKSARDSRRISDINNIKKSLSLYNTKTGKFPDPDDFINVVYSGSTVWSQGIVGEKVVRQLDGLSKIPLDPLFEEEYAYSLVNTKNEYELGSIMEGDSLANNTILFKRSYAEDKKYYALVTGNYNGQVAKVKSGDVIYVFAIPSIISSDLGNPDIIEIIKKKLFVFKGYQNIPHNYKGNNIAMTGSFDFGGNGLNPVIFSGSIDLLSSSGTLLKDFGNKLKLVYSGSILGNNSDYEQISKIDTNDSGKLTQVVGNIVNNNLGGDVDLKDNMLIVESGELAINGSNYPGCDSEDIILGVYSIAACNVGTSVAGVGPESYGRYFQWGEMYGWDSDGGVNSSDNFKYENGESIEGDNLSSWISTVSDTTGYGSDRWNGDNDPIAQGPCADGYHVPTKLEWDEIYSLGGWGSDGTKMSNDLKLPLAGYRSETDGLITSQSTVGLYWDSTPSSPTSYSLYFTPIKILTSYRYPRNRGESVRCIKKIPVDGICGIDNGKFLSNGLINSCTKGEIGNVNYDSNSKIYSWDCVGLNGGKTVSCSANNTVINTGYPGCDLNDIEVGEYKVAACNIGSPIAGLGKESHGRYFQWGEMYGWDSDGGITSSDNIRYENGEIVEGDSLSSYPTSVSSDGYGNYKWPIDSNLITQGPCAIGYHVPTGKEWLEIISMGGWGNDGLAISNALKIPFTTGRNSLSGDLLVSSYNSVNYWSATKNTTISFRDNNNTGNVKTVTNNAFLGQSVRCIKTIPIDGVCGSDNGQNLTNAPTNLCSKGWLEDLRFDGDSDTYKWTCIGKNGGTNANCIANNILDLTDSYPWCDAPDISIAGYKLSSCNVGATISGTGAMSYGKFFQWGEMYGRSHDYRNVYVEGVTPVYHIRYENGKEILGENLSHEFISNSVEDTAGDGVDRWKGDNDPVRQGPCAIGYHVPTKTEFDNIVSIGGWGLDGDKMRSDLKLPFTGYISRYINNEGSQGRYWTSTPEPGSTSRSYSLAFKSSYIYTPVSALARNYGASVRCIKD